MQRIRVILRPGRISADPDVATARVGESVVWELVTVGSVDTLGVRDIEWTIYFDHGSPFRGVVRLSTTTPATTAPPSPAGSPSSVGTLPPQIPDRPGDFKYGVRASDATTRRLVADDDPRLIVIP